MTAKSEDKQPNLVGLPHRRAMSDSVNLIVTTKSDLQEIIRDAMAEALSDQRTPVAELMSAERLGQRIGVHARTVRNWVLHGCPHVRAGRKLRFREPDVVGWLEARES